MRKIKTYSPELKAQIIKLAKTSDMPLSHVAQNLKMPQATLGGKGHTKKGK